MNQSNQTGLSPWDVVRLLLDHRKLIVTSAVAGAVLAAAYTLVAPGQWRATQALIVRADVAGISDQRLGKFSDLSEMKTLQETIFELAKSRNVVQSTLQRVGRPSGSHAAQWPTLQDVDDFRDRVEVTPPGGAEFGKTEVFYLSVLDPNRQRAKELISALCDELETRMQKLRDERARSMMAEIENTVTLASNDLQKETRELAAFEAGIGADLAEMRNLMSSVGGSSETAQKMRAIEAERRRNTAELQAAEKMIVMLQAAQQDPQRLIAMPNRLLESQPTLRQLKQALIDAQVRSAEVLGSKTIEHPSARAARDAEARVRNNLHQELAMAVKGLEFDVQFRRDRDRQLQDQIQRSRQRLSTLAADRAEYANLVASVDDHTQLLEESRRKLSGARAQHAGALSASIISRIDGVEAGTRPVGLGRVMTTAAGGVGGLLLGLGLVFLFADPAASFEKSANARHPLPAGQAGGESVNGSTEPAAPTGVDGATRPKRQPPVRRTPQKAPFGMFRGLSLEEAVRKLKTHDRATAAG